jgi:membrane associated rhomboid family serine protease
MIRDHQLRNSILVATVWTGLLWLVHILNVSLWLDPARFGIYPGKVESLIGVITAPLVHASLEHLLANTLPVLILGSALFYGYPKSRWWTLLLIWLLSGLGVWWLGRPSYHFGASGVIHGLLFFLFIGGVIRRDKLSIVLCMVAFSMYGGMLMTIFPTEPEISFESHFFGAVAGVLGAVLFQRWDPKAKPKQYSWEKTPWYEEDPLIGDLWMTEKQRAKLQREQSMAQAEREAATDADFAETGRPAALESFHRGLHSDNNHADGIQGRTIDADQHRNSG